MRKENFFKCLFDFHDAFRPQLVWGSLTWKTVESKAGVIVVERGIHVNK
jgi:hypothetical protein